jgi:hypothetical protein
MSKLVDSCHLGDKVLHKRKMYTLTFSTRFWKYEQDCNVAFEVLTAVRMKMAVFWVVAPCSLVDVYRRFRGNCCLHHQGDESPYDGGSKHL